MREIFDGVSLAQLSLHTDTLAALEGEGTIKVLALDTVLRAEPNVDLLARIHPDDSAAPAQ